MTDKDKFDVAFRKWISSALENRIPDAVKAFSFNLFEAADNDHVKFGIELIGANEFDLENSDWACAEIWEPEDRSLNIPVSFSGTGWEGCLSALQTLLETVLETDSGVSRTLKSRLGIGVGFIDGDMHIIWHATPSS